MLISYMPTSTGEKNIAWFLFVKNYFKAHIKALAGWIRLMGHMFDTPVLGK